MDSVTNELLQKLLAVYRLSPYIYNLYMFLKTYGMEYIIIGWNVCDSLWYVPITYDKRIKDEFDFEGQYITCETLSSDSHQRYDIMCASTRSCMLLSGISLKHELLPIIELFIIRCVDTDMHKRQKIQHDTLIKYMQQSIKAPLSAILQSVNLMHITNSASSKVIKNVNEEYELLKTLNNQYVEKIHKNVMTLSSNMFDIIDLAVLESGKFKIDKHTFNLHTLIENVVKIAVAINVNKDNVSINHYIEPNVPLTIYSDAKRVKQIIMALLDNAIKFTSHGEISLHVYATPIHLDKEDGVIKSTIQEHTQYSISFLVYDTGCGMDSKTISTLFKPIMMTTVPKQQHLCKRGDIINEATQHYGLSLRTSYLLAKYLYGTLTLQHSEINKGSCFNFSMIAYEDEPNVINTQTIKYLKGRRVLVIDHTTEKNTICTVLDKYCLVYNVANEYADLKILIPNKEYDIIMMNVDFPLVNVQLKEFIMKVKYIQHAIFIAIISQNNTMSEQDLLAFDDFVHMPSDETTYKTKLVMHLLTMQAVPTPI